MKIEKGVPIPEVRGRKPHGTYSNIGDMEIGDSFVAEGKSVATLNSALRQAAKRANIKITVRRIEKGDDAYEEGKTKVRVWRIEGECQPVAYGVPEM